MWMVTHPIHGFCAYDTATVHREMSPPQICGILLTDANINWQSLWPACWLYGWGPVAVWYSPLHYHPCHHSPYYCACPPPREEWSAASNECWIPGLFSVTFVSNDRAGPDWPNSDQLEWARGELAGRPDGPLVGRNTATTTPPELCQTLGPFWSTLVHFRPFQAILGQIRPFWAISVRVDHLWDVTQPPQHLQNSVKL